MRQNPGPAATNFLLRLEGVREKGVGWQARCPCRNDDNNPSLSIDEGVDGRVLVKCFRGNGCSTEEICEAVGMKVSELYGDSTLRSASTQFTPTKRLEQKIMPKEKEKLTFVKAYDYLDENGELLFQKVRYVNQDGKKTFRQRKPIGKGQWSYKLEDTPKILYNLPAVLAAKANGERIWVVEGEKDADTLIDQGIVATTSSNGAGSWLDIHTQALAGADVEIIADNDEPGKQHALHVMQELIKVGCKPNIWVSPFSKDVTDHFQSGHSGDELEIYASWDTPPTEELSNAEIEQVEIIEEEPEEVEEKSKNDIAVEKLNELLERDDLSAQQLIAKASLIISNFGSQGVSDPGRLVHWNDFISEQTDDKYEWVIPGLLEKQERVIVVAAEGVGKTMLARQVALCAAAGVHPFTGTQIPPVTTLTVDLENPERIIRRLSSGIVIQAMRVGHVNGRIHGQILTKPSGMDLLKSEDRLILEEALDRVRPQLLVMGPLYKAFVDPGGRTSESIAVEVAKYLDTIRTVYGCALWLEHHAPLGSTMATRDLRPFGSAVWSRWPEFGISLQPDPTASEPYTYEVRHFRGARDERQWPKRIKRGKRFPFEVLEYTTVTKL